MLDTWVTKTRSSLMRGTLHGSICDLMLLTTSSTVLAVKYRTQGPLGLLQSLEEPPYPWHTVTTDYRTGLPKTAAVVDAIVVFVDKLTKYVCLVACSKESSAFDWVSMFLDNVHEHFGCRVNHV